MMKMHILTHSSTWFIKKKNIHHFLDAFDDEPPTTTIVTKENAETVLKTIAGEELKRWIDDYSLSKFVFSGEADAVL